MDLIKGYDDQTDDDQDIRDDQMADETTDQGTLQSAGADKPPGDRSECDKLVVRNLIDGLTAAIDQDVAKESDAGDDKHHDGRDGQTKQAPAIRRRNEDEIVISSDEWSSDETNSDESSTESAGEDEPNSDPDEIDLDRCLTRLAPLKTKGEMLIEELPPPEEESIQLTCNVEQLQQIGSVNKILENLVVIESFKDLPALDLDSVLFFRTGKSIGRVFDVIGPVKKPFYIVRFVSNEKIQENSIFINMPVYFVPPNLCLASFQELNVTKYVLVSQLKSAKGTDASWLHNNEPPETVKEYSDDEEERRDQMKLKAKRKLQAQGDVRTARSAPKWRGSYGGL